MFQVYLFALYLVVIYLVMYYLIYSLATTVKNVIAPRIRMPSIPI